MKTNVWWVWRYLCQGLFWGILLSALVGCSQPTGTPPTSGPEASGPGASPTGETTADVNPVEELAEELSAETVSTLYTRDDVRIVDVRESDEYAAGHIPGAVLIPLGQLSDRLSELPQDKVVIFICRSGVRSGRALALAQQLGLTNVHHMAGGMLDWTARGYPVDR